MRSCSARMFSCYAIAHAMHHRNLSPNVSPDDTVESGPVLQLLGKDMFG